MNHDDDVRPRSECDPIAGLLVSAIAAIHRVYLHLHLRQRARDRYGIIVTGIVDNDNEIDDSLRHNFIVSLAQRSRRVIGGHHDNNFLTVEHQSLAGIEAWWRLRK